MAFMGILIVDIFLLFAAVVLPIIIIAYSSLFVTLVTVGIVLAVKKQAKGAAAALLIYSGAMLIGALMTAGFIGFAGTLLGMWG